MFLKIVREEGDRVKGIMLKFSYNLLENFQVTQCPAQQMIFSSSLTTPPPHITWYRPLPSSSKMPDFNM